MNEHYFEDNDSILSVLQAIIDDLRGVNADPATPHYGKPSSRELSLAVTKLEEAQHWILADKRNKDQVK